jgi:hypothetical protein
MERGVAMTADYLRRRMAAYGSPPDQVAAWVQGALAQVGEPRHQPPSPTGSKSVIWCGSAWPRSEPHADGYSGASFCNR